MALHAEHSFLVTTYFINTSKIPNFNIFSIVFFNKVVKSIILQNIMRTKQTSLVYVVPANFIFKTHVSIHVSAVMNKYINIGKRG